MTATLSADIDAAQAERFEQTARAIGTNGREVLRMFVAAFNAHGGFPYPPRVADREAVAEDSADAAIGDAVLDEIAAGDCQVSPLDFSELRAKLGRG
jgi:hypothetical protein